MSSDNLRPDHVDLLDIARSTFVGEILPVLPDDKRLAGLMIANALGIAQRMLAAPAGEDGDQSGLCAEIRAGLHDVDDAGELRTHLIKRTLARLAVSNPKALAEAERSLAGADKS
ncbi:MAG TPA: DUF6285 domain-containing protein [Geminicoccus sp.]|uniref:DUF6285 domain-containing protein n=1 Tax=Geminicoccus sp. TaxID=2024832 RepID=UPI002E32C673|nr:DUF6285 domain-containing protein [Geminicoccus sp.]HEX2525721.1 DUF6285 domain-containing protein [Geminicoccus sp.]